MTNLKPQIMKKILTLLLIAPLAVCAQTEISGGAGIAPFTVDKPLSNDQKVLSAIYGISASHTFLQHYQIGVTVMLTDFKNYYTATINGIEPSGRVYTHFPKTAVPVTLDLSYTTHGIYAGVNAGYLIAKSPAQARFTITEPGDYDYYWDQKSGAVLGAQIGYSHLIGKHFTLGAQVKADRYFGKYAIWYFPATIQAGWRL